MRSEIRSPHAVTRYMRGGRWRKRVNDARISVTIWERGATVTLFFDPETAWTGKAPLLELRFTPPDRGPFEPWRLVPQLALYVDYARASLAWDHGDRNRALKLLKQKNSPRRGLDDEFLQRIAQLHSRLVEEREPYPIKAIAMMLSADKSTTSRWVSAARARGYLPE